MNRRQANWQTVDSTFTCGQDHPQGCTQIQGLLCRWGGKISVCTTQSPGSNTWLSEVLTKCSYYFLRHRLSTFWLVMISTSTSFSNKAFPTCGPQTKPGTYSLSLSFFFCNPNSHLKPGFCFDELVKFWFSSAIVSWSLPWREQNPDQSARSASPAPSRGFQ